MDDVTLKSGLKVTKIRRTSEHGRSGHVSQIPTNADIKELMDMDLSPEWSVGMGAAPVGWDDDNQRMVSHADGAEVAQGLGWAVLMMGAIVLGIWIIIELANIV